ncbi:DNA polymerase III subunit gamma/tau [Vibrio sp. SCSIO 43137]|uniref:DNA polymerase III subunit gamma/tau n=1 Tax=Vibrio sp. SCSIO 43137 TaxID=3021011 RepID=UPI002307E3A0|nr:DNA polymerase III subunit gamma/tau [Vibrio sp. SCSIO 43137]WCE28919.1 DNA polymerase III subunit gamma/tau [Vibrio sp. SCSIO 43137]
MSYLALARKWRPNQFQQVVGQAHVLTALENALSQNKLHHAYLFSGTRGVGKTTIGRLFAKGLNCETGITSTPCGTCDTCREIDQGRFVDLLEIDAASRTKVEDTRELLDNVQYKPARGRFKVYLIDEVHMLSRHSFNALLKTLEEPPEYVKFLLATTDPQKLPVTILSRCLQFHLKPISVDNIHQQLNFILEHENVTADARALGMISHAADGSMRDALSLTDQAIALGNGAVSSDTVASMLGVLDTEQALYLLEAIAGKQAQLSMTAIQELAKNGVEWDTLLQELAAQLHRIAMYQALPSTLEKGRPDAERVQLLAQKLEPQIVQLYYQIALKGRQDLPYAPSEKMGAEMTVLRMIAFHPAKGDSATAIDTTLPEPIKQSSEAVRQAITPQPVETKAAESVAQPVEAAETEQLVQQQVISQPQVQTQPQSAPAQHMTPPQTEVAPESVQNSVEQAPPQETVAAQNVPSQATSSQNEQAPAMFSDENPPLPSEDDYPPMMPEEYEQEAYGFDEPSQYQQPQTAIPQPVVQQAPRSAPEQAQPEQASQAAAPRMGLRHQLRSKRANANTSANEAQRVKKSEPASPKNVLERVSQQHGVAARVMPKADFEPVKDDSQPYQWKPSKIVVEKETDELTPTQLKKALEHTKTPEMMAKLVEESVSQDSWASLIQSLDIPKLVEQLALNSAYDKQGGVITLNLRPSQVHLNTDKAQLELLKALSQALGQTCTLKVEIGEQGQTPLELRESLYQQKLKAAHTALDNDPNVQFIQARFAAELDSESVRPI